MKVAIIQKPPVLLDRDATIARAVHSIEEAVREGAWNLRKIDRAGAALAGLTTNVAAPEALIRQHGPRRAHRGRGTPAPPCRSIGKPS